MNDPPVDFFVFYSLLLGCAFFGIAMGLRRLFESKLVQRAFTIGAAFGASTNLLVWVNWFTVPRGTWAFGALARFSLVPGAPGSYIPGLWGEKMLLHHPHYSTGDSLWQWFLLTPLNVGVWSLVFATVALSLIHI